MSDFFFSPVGIIARHRWRQRKRVVVIARDIEPASKQSMSEADKLAFQKAVASGLAQQRRRFFRGRLALRLAFRTTGRTPAHLPNLGKNFMDLLGAPLPDFPGRCKGILYRDDRQVDALSVSCKHDVQQDGDDLGAPLEHERAPRIRLTAVRHALYLEDLASGSEAERHMEDLYTAWETRDDAVDEYRRMLDQEDADRRVLGVELHPAYLDLAARQAQERILASSRLSLGTIALLHGVVATPFPRRVLDHLSDRAVASLADSPTRILLGELPVRPGHGSRYKDTGRIGWMTSGDGGGGSSESAYEYRSPWRC